MEDTGENVEGLGRIDVLMEVGVVGHGGTHVVVIR